MGRGFRVEPWGVGDAKRRAPPSRQSVTITFVFPSCVVFGTKGKEVCVCVLMPGKTCPAHPLSLFTASYHRPWAGEVRIDPHRLGLESLHHLAGGKRIIAGPGGDRGGGGVTGHAALWLCLFSSRGAAPEHVGDGGRPSSRAPVELWAGLPRSSVISCACR